MPKGVRAAPPGSLRLPEPARFADCVVTGDTSAFAAASPAIVAALKAGGVCAEQLHLPDHGVTGNARLDLREKLRPSAGLRSTKTETLFAVSWRKAANVVANLSLLTPTPIFLFYVQQ